MTSDGEMYELVYGPRDEDDVADEFLIELVAMINNLSHPELLKGMAWARFSITQTAVASNPHCPPDVLAELAADPWSSSSAEAVAENPRTPVSALQLLTEHPADYVREAAAKNLARRV